MRACKIDGCERRYGGRGYCNMHYYRWMRYGDPHYVRQIHGDDASRFESKYVVDTTSGCWNWGGVIDPSGYGRFDRTGRPQKAHRVSWELHRGPIPRDLEIDHLCRNIRCVNPDHLEPVTKSENLKRAWVARALS